MHPFCIRYWGYTTLKAPNANFVVGNGHPTHWWTWISLEYDGAIEMRHSMPSSIAPPPPWCSLIKFHYISRTSPPQHKHWAAITTQIQKHAITVTRTRGRNGGHAMSTKGCKKVLDSMITQWLPSLAPSVARIRAWAPSTTRLGTRWLNPTTPSNM